MATEVQASHLTVGNRRNSAQEGAQRGPDA
jgi:hypothetical protein